MNLHLHIERLVLEGLPVTGAQGVAVQAALEAELGRLLTEGDLAPALLSGGTLSALSAPSLTLTEGMEPAQMGVQIAQSVYGSLGK